MKILFNKPYITKNSEKYIMDSLKSLKHCGNHTWNAKCTELLKEKYKFKEVFLVPSCTAALEMGIMLTGIKPGDEVILPSYTFSSTATAVLLSGGKPVFCEIEPNTMNIDTNHLKKLITDKTKCIMPIDYAGITCDIKTINSIASEYNIPVLVDSAQSLNSKTKENEWAGTCSELATFSFHETKNFSSGEGGALIVNKEEWIERAHFLQEKGTDRKLVIDGVKSKYGWVDIGSSYLLSDILGSLLFSQLENIDFITSMRKKVTDAYNKILIPFQEAGFIKCPIIPRGSSINHHAYFIIFDNSENRSIFLKNLKELFDVSAYIGYQPLHSSKKGKKLGYLPEDLPVTEELASRIVRLPLYTELGEKVDHLSYTTNSVKSVLTNMYS